MAKFDDLVRYGVPSGMDQALRAADDHLRSITEAFELTGLPTIESMTEHMGALSAMTVSKDLVGPSMNRAFADTLDASSGSLIAFVDRETRLLRQFELEGAGHAAVAASLTLQDRYQQLVASSIESYRAFGGAIAALGDFASLAPQRWRALPPAITGYPPRARRAHVDTLQAFRAANGDGYAASAELHEIEADEVLEETRSQVRSALGDLGVALLAQWDGGRQALRSSNPDRIRHFSSSFRELVKAGLQYLAPHDQVKGWTKDPRHFDRKGKPTRKARLLFLTRSLSEGQFADLVQADVLSLEDLIQLLDEGTHAASRAITDAEALYLETRATLFLHFLITLPKC